MWNLGNKTDEHGKGKKERESEANHKRLLAIENILRVVGGGCMGDGLDR